MELRQGSSDTSASHEKRRRNPSAVQVPVPCTITGTLFTYTGGMEAELT